MVKNPNWTPAEVEQLRGLWGIKTVPQIAKIMKRSENGIKVKSKRLKLGAFKDSSEYLPARQVSDLLGVDCHCVTDYWIPKQGLKFKKINPWGGKSFTYINISTLLEWLKEHPDKWDSRRVELYALGKEPDWLKKKRKDDIALAAQKGSCGKKWTLTEDKRAIDLYRQGKTIQQISDILNRSHAGVEHRLSRLDVWGTGKYIPEKERNQIKIEKQHRLKMRQLIMVLKARKNALNFDGYWQKDMCMHWNDLKGCTANEENCDSCVSFQRVKEQYCRRCGATIICREKKNICDRCAEQRRKQFQRKYAVMHSRGAWNNDKKKVG